MVSANITSVPIRFLTALLAYISKPLGHAGKFAAEYTGASLKSAIEKTPQWIQYAKLNPKARADRLDLISQALVEAYIQIDKDLLLLDEGGIMVSCLLFCAMCCCAWDVFRRLYLITVVIVRGAIHLASSLLFTLSNGHF